MADDDGLVGKILTLDAEPINSSLGNVPHFYDVISYLGHIGLSGYFYETRTPANGSIKILHKFEDTTKEICRSLLLYDREMKDLEPSGNSVPPICRYVPSFYIAEKTLYLEVPENGPDVSGELRLKNEKTYDWTAIRTSIKGIITGKLLLADAIKDYKPLTSEI
jgi:hypothetical protein